MPAHWRVVRNGSLFRQRNQTGFAELPILEVSLRTGVRVRDFETSKRKQVMSDFAKYKRAAAGDIAYNMMRMWQGAVGIAPVDGLVSPAYVVAAPFDGVEPRYFNELFRTAAYMAEVDNCSRGIVKDRNRLYWDQFKTLMSPCPPPDEEAAIVRFLAWATGQVDRTILAKCKVISLLNEQRQAILHREVTRGSNSATRLRPTGLAWLGDVPESWNVRRLRHLIQGRLTYGANAAADFTNTNWPRYIRITDFRTDGSLKAETFRSLPPEVANDYLVEPGDILLARSGATVGKAFLVSDITGAACHAGYLIRARPRRDLILPGFLYAFFQSGAFLAWKDATFNIATIQNIGADKYANLAVAYPSLPEQQVILDRLKVQQAPIVETGGRLQRELELLKEYRQRLVADVTSGRLDVRILSSSLPEENGAAVPYRGSSGIDNGALDEEEAAA